MAFPHELEWLFEMLDAFDTGYDVERAGFEGQIRANIRPVVLKFRCLSLLLNVDTGRVKSSLQQSACEHALTTRRVEQAPALFSTLQEFENLVVNIGAGDTLHGFVDRQVGSRIVWARNNFALFPAVTQPPCVYADGLSMTPGSACNIRPLQSADTLANCGLACIYSTDPYICGNEYQFNPAGQA